MKLNNDLHLDYSDVLIKPNKTYVYSRKDVNLEKTIYFPMSKQTWTGVPIMCANMDTIGTYEVYKVLSQYKMITCFHKFYQLEDFKEMDLDPEYFMISTGINDQDLEKLEKIIEEIDVKFICIDVANGYMDKLTEFCYQLRLKYPNKIIVAGNVVCKQRTKELIKRGKVDIVKVGIGSGCFDGNTSILMADGSYKNIKQVRVNDFVINKDGQPVKVLDQIYRGKKNIISIKSNNTHLETLVTPDHRYWIGNLDNLSINTIKKGCITKLLNRNIGRDRFIWRPIDHLNYNSQFGLMPLSINWKLPEKMIIDLKEFKNMSHEFDDDFIYVNNVSYKRYIEFNEEVGYLIGNYFFNLHHIKKLNDYIRDFEINDQLNIHYSIIKNLLQSFANTLPKKYYTKNIDFIKGLYRGLLNISNDEFNETKHIYHIQENVLELMYFCILSLGYSFKINSLNTKMTILKNNHTEKYNVNQIKKIKVSNELIDTYDLEVESDCHSFIANHSIVHNSACLTRTQTGIGVPQLSAIDDCASGAHDFNGFIIGDGGITCAGDISKGLGAGADFIMIGGLLGGHDENPGEVIEKNGKQFKQFYGMSSSKAMNNHYGKMDNYRSSEGRVLEIPYKGALKNTIEDLLGGVRSTCTYVGAEHINQLNEKCQFIRVNNQLNKMYDKF